jgi:hypothetical protein
MGLTTHHTGTRSIKNHRQNRMFVCKEKNYGISAYIFLTTMNENSVKYYNLVVLMHYTFFKKCQFYLNTFAAIVDRSRFNNSCLRLLKISDDNNE